MNQQILSQALQGLNPNSQTINQAQSDPNMALMANPAESAPLLGLISSAGSLINQAETPSEPIKLGELEKQFGAPGKILDQNLAKISKDRAQAMELQKTLGQQLGALLKPTQNENDLEDKLTAMLNQAPVEQKLAEPRDFFFKNEPIIKDGTPVGMKETLTERGKVALLAQALGSLFAPNAQIYNETQNAPLQLGEKFASTQNAINKQNFANDQAMWQKNVAAMQRQLGVYQKAQNAEFEAKKLEMNINAQELASFDKAETDVQNKAVQLYMQAEKLASTKDVSAQKELYKAGTKLYYSTDYNQRLNGYAILRGLGDYSFDIPVPPATTTAQQKMEAQTANTKAQTDYTAGAKTQNTQAQTQKTQAQTTEIPKTSAREDKKLELQQQLAKLKALQVQNQISNAQERLALGWARLDARGANSVQKLDINGKIAVEQTKADTREASKHAEKLQKTVDDLDSAIALIGANSKLSQDKKNERLQSLHGLRQTAQQNLYKLGETVSQRIKDMKAKYNLDFELPNSLKRYDPAKINPIKKAFGDNSITDFITGGKE